MMSRWSVLLVVMLLMTLPAGTGAVAHGIDNAYRVDRSEAKETLYVSVDTFGGDDSEPMVKVKLLKKALRKLATMLRSPKLDDVLSWLQRESNSHIVGVVRKHARKLADTLDELCKWEDLTMQAVRDQVAVALRAAGVPQGLSTEVAFWIKNFIEWTLL